MRPYRSLRALLVDVPPAHGRIILRAMEEAGWRLRVEHADGPDELAAALQRRGWGAVLYGGDGPRAVPARKALALVRLADPHLPFLAVSPYVHAGDLAAVVRGLDGAAAVVPDPAELPRALRRALDSTRLRRRVGGAHRFLLAQQAVTDHVAAGLEPGELLARVLATLGETLGWSCGAVWRPSPDGGELHCAATWHARERLARGRGAGRRLEPHRAGRRPEPARARVGVPPAGVGRPTSAPSEPRAATARRAGLMTATAFPIAIADHCAGVIEFFSHGINEPNPEVSAMFATVGGQLAQYLERHSGAVDGTRRWLDAAEAPLLALDAEGRVLLANQNACALAGPLGGGAARHRLGRRRRAAGRARLRARRADRRLARRARGRRRPARELAAHAAVRGRRRGRHLGHRHRARGAGRRTRSRRGCGARCAADELRLHYQPIFALRSGALVALEALLRWDDPVHGPVSPAEFIPVAEQSGLIDAIGDWVLERRLRPAGRVGRARACRRTSPSTSPPASCAAATSSPACASGSAAPASTRRG